MQRWTFALFSPFGPCESCCGGHWFTHICSRPCLQFLWVCPPKWNSWLDHRVIPFFYFFAELLYCFPKQLLRFIFSPAMHEGSNFSTSIERHTSLSNGREVVSHCGPNFFLTHSLPSGNENMVGIIPTDRRSVSHLALGRKAALSKRMTWMNSVFSTDSSCVFGPFADAPTYSPSSPLMHAFPLTRE